jgi:polyribonucleotide nucleotidyltransferase
MGELNKPVRVETEIGGRKLTIESGRLAKQAHGSVYIQYGNTAALVTAVSESKPKEGLDFFPLTIEFQEKFYAAGKIPGGFFKREARPSEWATLNCRLIDRPLRPLFPEGYRNPTQVVVTLLSYDSENECETIAGLGASAALYISDAPYTTPIATVRVGRVNGQLVINPVLSQLAESDLSILVAASRDALMMIEGGADSVPEEEFLEAIIFGHEHIKKLIDLQEELRKLCGKTKREFIVPKEETPAWAGQLEAAAMPIIKDAFATREKAARYTKLKTAEDAGVKAALAIANVDGPAAELVKASAKKRVGALKETYARELTVNSGARIDGRKYDQIRTIECETGFLPRVHGSSLFTRGETQALATITLGTKEDEQLIDSVRGKFDKRFLLHYNFPPFCVGETGRFGGNSRREVGHGALAERSVAAILPNPQDFPYTIRVVSEVLESNGSSSMATVCGASMALMDAGVPILSPVAGIAMGLMKEGDKVVVLSDILGDEDHMGDMDFKVCGTEKGITGVQMDIKMDGLSKEILLSAMKQARAGRLHILGEMAKAISTNKKEVSEYAPKFITIQISTEKIKDLIGPGGKNIKGIVAATGVKIDIEDSGKVNVASSDPAATEKALAMIKDLTEDAEIGRIYMGTVVRIAEFGAFVEIKPGTDGLVHISELDHQRVNRVTDVLQEGDQIPVKVLDVDRQGKIRLSRKAALPAPGGAGAPPRADQPRNDR